MTGSPRTEALRAIKAAVDKLGKYAFRRGDFDWQSHDYSQTPAVAYLMVMQGQLEVSRDDFPTRKATAQLVLVRGASGSSVSEKTLDDALIDELSDDAAWIIDEADSATYPGSQDFAVSIDKPNAEVREFHSPGLDIQGIAVTFEMQF